MSDDELKSIITEVGTIHYPNCTPEQLRELKGRLGGYRIRDAQDALADYARRHEFLAVEKLLAAIAEWAAGRDTEATVRRREAEQRAQSEIDAHWADIRSAIDAMPDDEVEAIKADVVADMADKSTSLAEMYRRHDPRRWRPLMGEIVARSGRVAS